MKKISLDEIFLLFGHCCTPLYINGLVVIVACDDGSESQLRENVAICL